jgi:hypothetical protein
LQLRARAGEEGDEQGRTLTTTLLRTRGSERAATAQWQCCLLLAAASPSISQQPRLYL